ncbi:vWA domain-containing protein [Neolewinella antarctica]|uniref:Uncharacterized protein YegL n=1 Tax=Neolewinella antarctica TaxID=442734 RepID=A0ABX0XC78_9BACT|nr:vWA domain-containing protein [Neolewinella antarctica]NJC26866.1 uncharacterized protein YegL [Neolewinella antarctica]
MNNPLSQKDLDWNDYLREAYVRGCAFVPGPVDEPTPLLIGRDAIYAQTQIMHHFLRSSKQAPLDRITKLVRGLDWRGFLIPADWLAEDLTSLTPRLRRLEDWVLHFRLGHYLEMIHEKRFSPATEGIPPELVAIFNFLPNYTHLLRNSYNHSVLVPTLSGPAMKERLRVEQLLEIIFAAARTVTGRHESPEDLNRLVASADDAVQAYFRLHLKLVIVPGFQKEHDAADGTEFHNETARLEKDFYQYCGADAGAMQIREMIAGDYANKLPDWTTRIIESTRQATGTKSIFDRIANYVINPAPAPIAIGAQKVKQSDLDARVSRLNPRQYKRLLNKTGVPEIANAAHRAHQRRLVGILNTLTAPALRWKLTKGAAVPDFNYRSKINHADRYREFAGLREQEIKEGEHLARLLPRLRDARSTTTLAKMTEEAKFRNRYVHAHWQKAHDERHAQLEEVERFRDAKAAEYGLVDFQGRDFARELYLDEIVRIEQEITPFVPYVRQAFKAALPVRRTVEFTTNRHAIDGPEFDPEILVQPEKYLRGEVMKTFREKRREIPIAQVNAFCLDYSKSMTHEPMRNLFKLVFLLILGLEDRKTFDAIYFFGSDFINVVDFGKGYTDRQLLFPILRFLSTVQGYQVYYAGKGYTNISAGIDESQGRVVDFAASLAGEDPDLRLVRSVFMLTDGEPTGGIFDPDKLRDFIEEKREGGTIAIKGIYLNTGDNVGSTVTHIFGAEHTVETDSFEHAVTTFVNLMTATYKEQRRAYRRALRNADLPPVLTPDTEIV